MSRGSRRSPDRHPRRTGTPRRSRRRKPDEEDAPVIRDVGSVVREALGGLGGGAEGLSLGRLVRDWEAVVGPGLAAESAPIRLRNRHLMVGASGPEWAAQVRFLAAEIARNANAILGARSVDSVRVAVRPEVRKPLQRNPSWARQRGADVPRGGARDDTI